MSRSKKVNIKVSLSSRTDIGIERHFWKNAEAEKQPAPADLEHKSPGDDSQPGSSTNSSLLHERTYEETTMLTVTERTKLCDMIEYLNMSLRRIMKQRVPRTYHLDKRERNLVMLVLDKIIYTTGLVNTIEAAEQLKKICLKDSEEEASTTKKDYSDCKDESSEGGVNGDDVDEASKPAIVRAREHQGVEREMTGKSLREERFEQAMHNPEIFATVNQLGVASRDSFKSLNNKQDINVIHTTVRVWFERETMEAVKKDFSIRDLFRLYEDKDKGHMILRLRIPSKVIGRTFPNILFSDMYKNATPKKILRTRSTRN
ncbi:hypothetical protein TWF730_007458 [Orbilia blumenaviensis]|uniref:Transposase n=1 Tax=Orbilia blumenaviensis TaxID=1796055 RepID=A0AAV9V8K1_9PEZI